MLENFSASEETVGQFEHNVATRREIRTRRLFCQ